MCYSRKCLWERNEGDCGFPYLRKGGEEYAWGKCHPEPSEYRKVADIVTKLMEIDRRKDKIFRIKDKLLSQNALYTKK